MGAGQNKIRKILECSIKEPNLNEQKNIKLEYKYQKTELMDVEENMTFLTNKDINENEEEDSFIFSTEVAQVLNNPKLDVKNSKKFPYITIGTITAIFPVSEIGFVYTCFLIGANAVVTLASNLVSKNKGGKAKSIITSFSEEKVKWENIYIQDEKNKDKDIKIKGKNNDKISCEPLDGINLTSKLAVILYENNICSEWIGIEEGKREDFFVKEINAVFTFKDDNNIFKNREIFVGNVNPFCEANNKGTDEEKELIMHSPGSPLYYKDYNNGAYAIAIINEFYEFQYFDRKTMLFLADMVIKGKLLREKINKEIDEDNIVKLNLQRNNFGPLDIRYLIDFKLKNLRILDLSNNSIKAEGVFYLSNSDKFSSLESLNLDFNDIRDEGLNHIVNGYFSRLNNLYISNNNISSDGIKYLVKAEFVNNLIILSLSGNPKIGDSGIRIMKDHKGWGKLSILSLNNSGLTDVSLSYLGESSMPKLKQLNIQGNKFTETGKASIYALRMNYIYVSYRAEAEEKEEEKKKLIYIICQKYKGPRIKAEKIKEKERNNYKINIKE